MIAICTPHDGGAQNPGNGNMIAIPGGSREGVDKPYASDSLGASDEGAPGERMPVFYGAYVRDLDGNKLWLLRHEARHQRETRLLDGEGFAPSAPASLRPRSGAASPCRRRARTRLRPQRRSRPSPDRTRRSVSAAGRRSRARRSRRRRRVRRTTGWSACGRRCRCTCVRSAAPRARRRRATGTTWQNGAGRRSTSRTSRSAGSRSGPPRSPPLKGAASPSTCGSGRGNEGIWSLSRQRSFPKITEHSSVNVPPLPCTNATSLRLDLPRAARPMTGARPPPPASCRRRALAVRTTACRRWC